MEKFKKGNSITDGGSSEWDEGEHPRDEDGRFISINEFRFLEKHADEKQHPAHLYARKDKEVKYHQLTHSERIKGEERKNIELNSNPNPKDLRRSFFVPKSKDGEITDFRKVKKDWVLSKEDDELMKPYRDDPFNKK